MATAPGARYVVKLDTRFEAGDAVALAVTYLVSYDHMGRARFWCQGGCACNETEVDALVREQGLQVRRGHTTMGASTLGSWPGAWKHRYNVPCLIIKTYFVFKQSDVHC